MKSGWVRFLVTVISLVMIVNLSQSIYSLWRKGSVVEEQTELKAKLEKDNQDLKKRLEVSKSQEFIEKEARDKLNLQKEGEVVVVIPQILLDEEVQLKVSPTPNWQMWWERVF